MQDLMELSELIELNQEELSESVGGDDSDQTYYIDCGYGCSLPATCAYFVADGFKVI